MVGIRGCIIFIRILFLDAEDDRILEAKRKNHGGQFFRRFEVGAANRGSWL